MGFRFVKSFNLGGGFRFVFSKKIGGKKGGSANKFSFGSLLGYCFYGVFLLYKWLFIGIYLLFIKLPIKGIKKLVSWVRAKIKDNN